MMDHGVFNDKVNKTWDFSVKLHKDLKIWSKKYMVYWHTQSILEFNLTSVLDSIGKKQELNIKCFAWKGFIPRLQWKSPSPKNYWVPKILGQNQILGPKKFRLENITIFDPKIFQV